MKSIVQSPSASLDVVTPLDRAIGAMLGLACADSLLDRHVHFGDEQLSGLSLLPSAVGWGEVTLANIALASALLASDTLQMQDLLLRYQRQDGRHLYPPCGLQSQWLPEVRMVTCSDSLLRVPLSLQLLPIVLFHQQESDLRQACISSRLLLDGMVSEPYQAQLQQLGQMLSALLAGDPIGSAIQGCDSMRGGYPEALISGLADFPVILTALQQQPNFHAGLCWVVRHSSQTHAACGLYGMLAGAMYGEKFLPQVWLNLLAGGEELRNLAWMLYMGLTGEELSQAVLNLGLISEHHRALRPLNRVVVRTPSDYQPGLPLQSALAIDVSLPCLGARYAQALSWLEANPNLHGQRASVEAALLTDPTMQFVRLYARYASWLKWPIPERLQLAGDFEEDVLIAKSVDELQ